MSRAFILGLLAGALACSAPAAAQPRTTSAYTPLDLDRCRVLSRVEEGASVVWRCPGHGGVPLFVLSGDERYDLDAGIDNGTWESRQEFSSPPRRVEWRLRGGRPFAIIYRLTLTADDGGGTILVVETVGRPGAPGCEIALIHGSVPNANAVARRHADRRAAGFRCGEDAAEYEGPGF